MTATAETVKKLNSLTDHDHIMIVNLINQLFQKNEGIDDLELFEQIREETSKSPMTDKEIEEVVSSTRRELYGHRG